MPPYERRPKLFRSSSVGATISFLAPHSPRIVGMGEFVTASFRTAHVPTVDAPIEAVLVTFGDPDVADLPMMIVQRIDAMVSGQRI